MGRFRYGGIAWDNQPFVVVPCLVKLGDQITAADPTRYAVDGTVASRDHDLNSPGSDHSPDENNKVRALDWGGVEEELDDQLEALRLSRDERIKYVIYEGRMFSSYSKYGYGPFEWRPYGGWAPHDDHGHISTWEWADDNDRDWELEVAQFTPDEVQELKNLVAGLKSMVPKSSGWGFSRQGTELIRKERDEYPLEVLAENSTEDGVARLGVEANAKAINEVKETLRSV